ncbi:TetR family transcriptional regulator [Paraburkholderia silvatlantica]|uniref:TetR family transcriptional regulator n=1 Tax=Paraburkholderia silvatlantica TaxID=321895 RepID=A0A2V4TJT8_9BURK|nr:TetR/AcrR family transcriptional regulator [Paraburkholderia silvatlantica]PYE21498.1 TetR family transcriptional regulator [Paraburkholderia silvatlantica]
MNPRTFPRTEDGTPDATRTVPQQCTSREKFKPVGATPKGQERIEVLLDIGCAIVTAQSLADLTLRNIARTAGMRLSNVQHYFPTQIDLLRAVIAAMIGRFEQAAAAHLAKAKVISPRSAFIEICRYYLQLNRQRSVRALFFDLGALAQRDAVVRQLLREAYQPYRAHFDPLIEQLNPTLSKTERAHRVDFLTAAIEGSMYVSDTVETTSRAEMAAEKRFLTYLLQIATL